MENHSTPSTMRIWKYSSAQGGLEKHLRLYTSELVPRPTAKQHLVQVLAVGLNPVDFKPAEAGLVGRLIVKKPATPGFDISGRIVIPADGSDLEPGDIIYGATSTNPLAGGGLAEYIVTPADTVSRLPAEMSPLHAAGTPVAAITAFGSIVAHIKAGSRVFLNGGSGGVGTYGIQIAKAAGAHVTVSCSAGNLELCRSLGADNVLDYTKRPLLEQLREIAATGHLFDHVVDNVFSDPALYFQAHTYTSPSAKFVEVASGPTLAFLRFAFVAQLLPSFLGGGRRKFVVFLSEINCANLELIGKSISDSKIKLITDKVFPMDEAVEAFKRLKTGRARGKVLVQVAKKIDC